MIMIVVMGRETEKRVRNNSFLLSQTGCYTQLLARGIIRYARHCEYHDWDIASHGTSLMLAASPLDAWMVYR
jgi:hypothetical protein